MYVKFDTENLATDTVDMINRIKTLTERKQRKALWRIGDVIEKSVRKNMNFRSGINREKYTHMQDDVEVSVRTNKDGKLYVSVGGGKETGYKWRWLNDGSISNKGTVLVQATHFMEKAQKDSEVQINNEIDKMLREVLKESGE